MLDKASQTGRAPITKMSGGHYGLIAEIIRRIPDDAARKVCADHFATEFNRRSISFDPYRWERITGGRPAPESAK